MNDLYYNNNPLEYYENENITKCYNEILSYRHDDLLYLINDLRLRINNIHSGIARKDFLYHYILNNYSLNTLNCDIYENNIQSNQFDDYELYDIIILLGTILYELICNEGIMQLSDLLQKVNMYINSIQGVKSLKFTDKKSCKKINNDFSKFCQKKNTSFGKGWLIVRNRNKNFDIRHCIDIKNTTRYGLIGICYSKK